MSTFLVIYSKKNKIVNSEVEAILNDFSLNGKRAVMLKQLPGVCFCYAEKFQKCFIQTKDSLSLVSGHISFHNINKHEANENTLEIFNTLTDDRGSEIFPQLEGMFAALHYSIKEHRLIIGTDKFGMSPLFVGENKHYLVASNEYQPLLALNNKRELNVDAIAEYFTLGTTLGTKTFFKNIIKAGPASLFEISADAVTTQCYWHPPEEVSLHHSTEELAEKVLQTFTKVNREYLDAGLIDVCLLTAGADSRLILATSTEEQRKKTTFYTSNLSFLDPKEDMDVIGASSLTEKFKLKHRVEKISFYENEFGGNYFDKERELREGHVYGGWHGGELFGGYCLKAAPIRTKLSFKEIDEKLKSIFSWRFRWKLKNHPYKALQQEKLKYAGAQAEFLFLIRQLTGAFFTTIYGGSKGHWLQTYQLMNHGFSPFWDSRVLQQLLQVPLNVLKDYHFYNKIFKHISGEFTSIPSNSPLTLRSDSVIPRLVIGTEPKLNLPDTYQQAYKKSLQNPLLWKRGFYNKTKMIKTLSNETDDITRRWLDFEVWFAKYSNQA